MAVFVHQGNRKIESGVAFIRVALNDHVNPGVALGINGCIRVVGIRDPIKPRQPSRWEAACELRCEIRLSQDNLLVGKQLASCVASIDY